MDTAGQLLSDHLALGDQGLGWRSQSLWTKSLHRGVIGPLLSAFAAIAQGAQAADPAELLPLALYSSLLTASKTFLWA